MRLGAGRSALGLPMAAVVLCLSVPAHAERLPIRTYTVADGLARNRISGVTQDSHGFIWVSTSAGLSRFDGYGFTNFGPEDGLPSDVVQQVLESHGGVLWVATAGGLAYFDPRRGNGAKPFDAVPLPPGEHIQEIGSLLEEPSGTILAGTNGGLLRIDPAARPPRAQLVDFGRPPGTLEARVRVMTLDRKGGLWFFTESRLVHVDGARSESIVMSNTCAARTQINAALTLPDGRIVVAGDRTFDLDLTKWPRGDPFRPIGSGARGLPHDLSGIFGLALARDGRILAVSAHGFAWVDPRDWSIRSGSAHPQISNVFEDRDLNLWLGSSGQGLLRLDPNGLTSYGIEDALPDYSARQIGESANGEVYVVHYPVEVRVLGPHGPERIPTRVGPGPGEAGWGQNRIVLQDSRKEWWIASTRGLLRYPARESIKELAGAAPLRVYDTRDGLPGNAVFQLIEDRDGDVWIGLIGYGKGGLARWRRSTDTIQSFPIPKESSSDPGVTALEVDRSGAVWVGFFGGGVARIRNGRLDPRPLGEATPPSVVSMILGDSKGRLWIAASPVGVLRIDRPDDPSPIARRYGKEEGLSSTHVRSLLEDAFGRIYIGGSNGIDRLDAETGGVRHLTAQEGLAGEELEGVAFRDHAGKLWFGTASSICKMTPVHEPAAPPAATFISGMHIAGARQSVSATGERRIESLGLRADQRNIEFDFGALEFRTGNRLLYQTRLEGADPDWSPPSSRRTVSYASLAPGSYRFLARAVDGDSLAGEPAVVAFVIPPPVWRRGWFVTLAAGVLLAIATAAYRTRIARVQELERVRTRIATDLHDDVGSGLTYISMVSDLARAQKSGEGGRLDESLGRIASLSSELVDSMSDIVWAINPAKDTLADLVQRMRWFANDLCDARGIALTFEAPDGGAALELPAEQRRQAYLLFKEAITNMAKHSECREAEVKVDHARNRLRILLRDDGKGLEPKPTGGGTGLASMKRRAAAAGGTAEIRAPETGGMEVSIELPIRKARGGGVIPT